MSPFQLPTIDSLEAPVSEQLRVALCKVVDAFATRVDQSAGSKATNAAAIVLELQTTVDEAKAFVTSRYAAPTVTSLSDASGPAAGGEYITLVGTNFLNAHAVDFEGTDAPDFVIISNVNIRVRVPAHAAGVANVHVTNSVATSADAAGNEYTYS